VRHDENTETRLGKRMYSDTPVTSKSTARRPIRTRRRLIQDAVLPT
jgi:hypothetical protein